MSAVTEFIAQFSSFKARPQRRDLELRALRIRGLRSVLIFVIIMTALMFLSSFILSAFLPKGDLQSELVKGDSVVFDKPTFIGHSTSGGKIIVTADEATRPINSEVGEVVLKSPVVTTQSGAKITANSGRWDQTKQKLLLRENVTLHDKSGSKATADFAFWGVLEAQSEPSNNNIERLYLTGNVKFEQFGGGNITSSSAIWNEEVSRLVFSSKPIVQISGPGGKDAKVIGTIAGGSFGAGHLEIDTNGKIAYGTGETSINTQSVSALANSFEFHFDSKRLILKGNARATYSSK